MQIRSASNGGDTGIDYDGSCYLSDTFALNNQSGVAGPDGGGFMGGQMGGFMGGTQTQPGSFGGGTRGSMQRMI